MDLWVVSFVDLSKQFPNNSLLRSLYSLLLDSVWLNYNNRLLAQIYWYSRYCFDRLFEG